LKIFFVTTISFDKKEVIKKAIDINVLLNFCISRDEEVARQGGLHLFNIYCIYSAGLDEEDHCDYLIMKRDGTLEKIYYTFKECFDEKVKRLIGLVYITIDRKCSILDNSIEIIKWLINNTDESTDDISRHNTLVSLRKVTISLISFIFLF
jgi:hypothetical protein